MSLLDFYFRRLRATFTFQTLNPLTPFLLVLGWKLMILENQSAGGATIFTPERRKFPSGLFRKLFKNFSATHSEQELFLSVPKGVTLLHVTHWKAGSQWMRSILNQMFGSAVRPVEYSGNQLVQTVIEDGSVYPCLYVGKEEFSVLEWPQVERHFVVIRDLRDTLISGYFSLRYSHAPNVPSLRKRRLVLEKLSVEAGLLYLLESWLPQSAAIQRSWLFSDEHCFRFEDFMGDAAGLLGEILRTNWGVDAEPNHLKSVIEQHSFKRLSGGRCVGQEDIKSHYRKGQAGDWRQHFTPMIKVRFKRLYSDLLVRGGYETDDRW